MKHKTKQKLIRATLLTIMALSLSWFLVTFPEMKSFSVTAVLNGTYDKPLWFPISNITALGTGLSIFFNI